VVTTREAWVSPLVEVERAVQERAKATYLDLATDGGPDRLRALIEDEVARWSEDYKRGSGTSTWPTRRWLWSGPIATSPATDRSSPSSLTTTCGKLW
jgi:hypothetical protein